MPETEIETISKEWLQGELRSGQSNLIIFDCRSSNEFQEGHIRSAVNFSIPSIMLRRLGIGKIELTSTINNRDLKQRIQNAYNDSLFILYNNSESDLNCDTINVLHRRLKQDGCRAVCLQDGFKNFHSAFPEWCEEDSTHSETQTHRGTAPTDQLMGLRSLRISTPHTDSACNSSAESSDCESTTTHPQLSEAPVEILPGLFLGNVSHSEDSTALEKYNIQYILNVTPDLPNVFEASGGIRYLQIPITDHWSQDMSVYFPDAINFIDEARTKGSAVLVHCLAGVSRSVTVTLAYLMHARSLRLDDAFTFVRSRKPDISPNLNFFQQLQDFEIHLTKTNPNRTPLSADSSYLTPDCDKCPLTATIRRPTKYSCGCLELECQCMQMQTDFLVGASPDSGIEFDRWPPNDGTPK